MPKKSAAPKPAPTLTLAELLEYPLNFYMEDVHPKCMDSYFIIFLKSLESDLEGAAAGIAKLIIANEESDAMAKLSDRQRFVLRHYILDEHVTLGSCECDGAEFTWEDQHTIVQSKAFGHETTYWHENCLAHALGEDQP